MQNLTGLQQVLSSRALFLPGRMIGGFTHSQVLLAFLIILCVCLGNIQNKQSLKTFGLSPSSCSETAVIWYLRKKMQQPFSEDVLWTWEKWIQFLTFQWLFYDPGKLTSSTCALVQNLLHPTKLPWVWIHYYLIQRCARALLQWVHSVGKQVKAWDNVLKKSYIS